MEAVNSVNVAFLEIYGSGYVIDYCISTINNKRKEEVKEAQYRAYITDALMVIAENTTHFVGAQDMIDYGKTLKTRWVELMEYVKPTEETNLAEDNRTVEEFAANVFHNMKKKKR